jgi:hypothetical protein
LRVSVSQHIGISPERFAQTGALDSILSVDSKLFIDPHLLPYTSASELKDSYDKVRDHFRKILKLLAVSNSPGDAAWRNAARLFKFREIRGLSIGYSSKSTAGSGMGRDLSHQLLNSAKLIVDAGIDDPEIFELMGLFEPGVGADRLSDMVASIILGDLLNFSERVFAELDAPTRTIPIAKQNRQLVWNPFSHTPIILVPRDVLRNLPVAHERWEIDEVVSFNEELRSRVNETIGEAWRDLAQVPKSVIKDLVLNDPEILRSLIRRYRHRPATQYDFANDPAGQVNWRHETVRVAEAFPLYLSLSSFPTVQEVFEIVLAICDQFKQHVENNRMHRLLYNDDGSPKKEEAAQLMFFGLADVHCSNNNLDLSPEVNAGRGPVDFKISRGYHDKVLVETKLTTNTRLLHGFEKQLREYEKAEQTTQSIFLVIDVNGGSKKRLDELERLVAEAKSDGRRVPHVIVVNGRSKPSASKA